MTEHSHHQVPDIEHDDGKPWPYWVAGITALLVVATITYLTPYVVEQWAAQFPSISSASDFANQFDVANAVFSGLAFSGVIITLFLQRAELKLQRKEIKDNRIVMEQQRDEFKHQVAVLRKQNFESTFFQMLSAHEQLRGEISWRLDAAAPPLHGRECISRMSWANKEFVGNSSVVGFSDVMGARISADFAQAATRDDPISEAGRRYDIVDSRLFADRTGHFFRSLYVILSFIEKSEIEDRDLYYHLVRAQMTHSEFSLLFYYCLGKHGSVSMLPLMEKLDFFQNASTGILADPSHKKWIRSRFLGDSQ